jgi:uncharacterized protein YqeY
VLLDDVAIAIVDKLIKQRKDSIEAHRRPHGPADIESAELLVLTACLPHTPERRCRAD